MYQRSIIHRWKRARLASDKSSLLRVANGPLGSTLTNYKNSTNFKSCVIKIDKGIKYEKTVSSQRETDTRWREEGSTVVLPLDIFGRRRNSHCNRCTVCLVSTACQEYRKALNSMRTMICKERYLLNARLLDEFELC